MGAHFIGVVLVTILLFGLCKSAEKGAALEGSSLSKLMEQMNGCTDPESNFPASFVSANETYQEMLETSLPESATTTFYTGLAMAALTTALCIYTYISGKSNDNEYQRVD